MNLLMARAPSSSTAAASIASTSGALEVQQSDLKSVMLRPEN